MKLDKRDRIILTALEFNARIKEREMAKLCHLSKDAVRYRIRKLESEGIISGYSCFFDFTKLGFVSYKLYLKIRGSEAEWANLRAFLDMQPGIFARFEAQSDWNFGIAFFAKTMGEYYLFERDLFDKFGGVIESSELCHMVDATIFEPRMLLGKDSGEFQFFVGGDISEIDDLDRRIISLLLKDSSVSLLSIAENIKLSPDATKKRIQRLEKDRIICKYITNVNYHKLGFEIYKVFFSVKQYSEGTEKKMISKLGSYFNTRNIVRMIGPWKLEVEFICSSYDEFFTILKEIRATFPDNITSINYAIFRNEIFYPSGKVVK